MESDIPASLLIQPKLESIISAPCPEYEELIQHKSRTCAEQLEIERQKNRDLTEKIADYHDRKLYHELSLACQEYLFPQNNESTTTNNGRTTEKAEFCLNVLGPIKTKIREFRLLQIVVKAALTLNPGLMRLKFLDYWFPCIRNNRDAIFFFRSVQAHALVTGGFYKEADNLLFESLEPVAEAAFGLSTDSLSAFYKAAAASSVAANQTDDVYRFAMLYVATTSLGTIQSEERIALAYHLCRAAIISRHCYSFVELKQQAVLHSLKADNVKEKWILDLLMIMDRGLLTEVDSFALQHQPQIQESGLEEHWSAVRRKVQLMRLLNLAFERPVKNRALTFEDIREACQIEKHADESEIELLIIEALSYKLIDGSIDGVEKCVFISSLQPRLLEQKDIETMASRFLSWSTAVSSLANVLDQQLLKEAVI